MSKLEKLKREILLFMKNKNDYLRISDKHFDELESHLISCRDASSAEDISRFNEVISIVNSKRNLVNSETEKQLNDLEKNLDVVELILSMKKGKERSEGERFMLRHVGELQNYDDIKLKMEIRIKEFEAEIKETVVFMKDMISRGRLEFVANGFGEYEPGSAQN